MAEPYSPMAILYARVIEIMPQSLQNPAIWISVIVGFYIIVLYYCLTGALNRQKATLDLNKKRKEISSVFDMLDEDSEEGEKKD